MLNEKWNSIGYVVKEIIVGKEGIVKAKAELVAKLNLMIGVKDSRDLIAPFSIVEEGGKLFVIQAF
jgi:hypothetical protein